MFVFTLPFCISAYAEGDPSSAAKLLPADPSINDGFRLLYNLNFDHAHEVFAAWEETHPEDPVGPVSDAAGLLFAEFHRLGILEAQFYVDDKTFDSRKRLSPDVDVHKRFEAALVLAESRAQARLAKDPKDHDALFAMTLSSGLKADYAALVEKRNMASLSYTRQATRWAEQILAVHPECYDARLATGISQYIIGSMAAPMRWILRLGGVSGDKKQGIADLELTAQHGTYLAPFARILLAIAYVREKDTPHARALLASLRDEFPGNPLFQQELARLSAR